MFYFQRVKQDILGIKKVHGSETNWAVLERESLIGESLAETSAREPLGELPFSRLRHLGLNRCQMFPGI